MRLQYLPLEARTEHQLCNPDALRVDFMGKHPLSVWCVALVLADNLFFSDARCQDLDGLLFNCSASKFSFCVMPYQKRFAFNYSSPVVLCRGSPKMPYWLPVGHARRVMENYCLVWSLIRENSLQACPVVLWSCAGIKCS